jgi:hypothetical protein
MLVRTLLSLFSAALVLSGCTPDPDNHKKNRRPPSAKTADKSTNLDSPVGAEFVAAEQAVVDRAMERAKLEGKLVAVNMSAAWCNPCQKFKKAFHEQESAMSAALAKWEFVVLEQTTTEMPWGFWDFLPMVVTAVPTFFLIDPTTGSKTMFSTESPDDFKRYLESFETNRSLVDGADQKVREALRTGTEVNIDDLYSVVDSMTPEQGIGAFRPLWNDVVKAMKEHPDQFPVDKGYDAESLNSLFYSAYSFLISEGVATLSDVVAEAPVFARSDILTYPSLTRIFSFEVALQKTYITQGSLAAARQCDSLAQRTASLPELTLAVPPEGASAEEIKRIEEENTANRAEYNAIPVRKKQICTLLKGATGLVTQEELKKVVQEDAASRVPMEDDIFMRTAVFAGEYAAALRVLERTGQKEQQDIAELHKQYEGLLSEAQAAGDQAKIARYTNGLAFVEFKGAALRRSYEARKNAWSAGVSHSYRLAGNTPAP